MHTYWMKASLVAALLVGHCASTWAAPSNIPATRQPLGKPSLGNYVEALKNGALTLNKEGADGFKKGKDVWEGVDKWEKTLANDDKRFEPNYAPPGAPDVPSKCYEIKSCRPCYEQAYAEVNKTRGFLEKVRARYDYTHRFTTKGKAFMQGVAGAAGGAAAIGAQYEADKIDKTLVDFDSVVRNKNLELLDRLKGNLKEVAVCEAKFYKNDDWYDRYGYMYFQFMQAHYSYAQKP